MTLQAVCRGGSGQRRLPFAYACVSAWQRTFTPAAFLREKRRKSNFFNMLPAGCKRAALRVLSQPTAAAWILQIPALHFSLSTLKWHRNAFFPQTDYRFFLLQSLHAHPSASYQPPAKFSIAFFFFLLLITFYNGRQRGNV